MHSNVSFYMKAHTAIGAFDQLRKLYWIFRIIKWYIAVQYDLTFQIDVEDFIETLGHVVM